VAARKTTTICHAEVTCLGCIGAIENFPRVYPDG
jgi:hypothetical protein